MDQYRCRPELSERFGSQWSIRTSSKEIHMDQWPLCLVFREIRIGFSLPAEPLKTPDNPRKIPNFNQGSLLSKRTPKIPERKPRTSGHRDSIILCFCGIFMYFAANGDLWSTSLFLLELIVPNEMLFSRRKWWIMIYLLEFMINQNAQFCRNGRHN